MSTTIRSTAIPYEHTDYTRARLTRPEPFDGYDQWGHSYALACLEHDRIVSEVAQGGVDWDATDASIAAGVQQ